MPQKIRIDEVAVVENNIIVFRTKEFKMAPETSIAGTGKFVRTDAAEKMINDYVNTNEKVYLTLKAAESLILANRSAFSTHSQEIETIVSDLKDAIEILSPKNDIVSGTYGKELLQNLLSRENCEGLRYTCCRYEGKNSIVFTPVDSTGENKNDQLFFQGKLLIDDTDPKGEIKGLATSREELQAKRKHGMAEIPETGSGTDWGKRLLSSKD